MQQLIFFFWPLGGKRPPLPAGKKKSLILLAADTEHISIRLELCLWQLDIGIQLSLLQLVLKFACLLFSARKVVGSFIRDWLPRRQGTRQMTGRHSIKQ